MTLLGLDYDQWGITSRRRSWKYSLMQSALRKNKTLAPWTQCVYCNASIYHQLQVSFDPPPLNAIDYSQLVSKTLEGHEMDGGNQSLGWIGQSCWCRGGNKTSQAAPFEGTSESRPSPRSHSSLYFLHSSFFFLSVSSFSLFLYTIVLPSQKKKNINYLSIFHFQSFFSPHSS